MNSDGLAWEVEDMRVSVEGGACLIESLAQTRTWSPLGTEPHKIPQEVIKITYFDLI